MKANRFYSVPFDARNDTKILKLGKLQRGKMAAYGRWQALLGMLFDEDGMIDVTDATTEQIVCDELGFSKSESMHSFFGDCAAVGLIDRALWEGERHVVNPGVADELAFRASKAEAGRRGGKAGKAADGPSS